MGVATKSEDRHSPIGSVLFGYKVVREVGRGGMGVVYEAVHESIGQRAAVKVLDSSLHQDPKAAEHLLAEARAASAVVHSGVVKIFNGGQLESGEPYLIMEFIEGESLQKRLARLHDEQVRMPLAEALRIGADIADVLAAVHQRNIVHRDLKPGNVLLSREEGALSGERIRVVDFGIAKLTESESSGTTTQGKFIGTALYASPEQCGGEGTLGPPSDVYSLGVMLYELISGKPPFNGPTMALLGMHMMKVPPSLREAMPECPAAVHAVVHQMLEKKPDARPTMNQVAGELRAVIDGSRRQSSGPRTRWATALGAAGGIALLVGGLTAGRYLLHPSPMPATLAPGGGKAQQSLAPATPLDSNHARIKALEVVAEGLRDREPLLRQRALLALAQTADPMTRPLVEPMLRDADGRVQSAAAHALGRMKTAAAKKALLARFNSAIEPHVSLALLESLQDMGAGDATGKLARLAIDPDPDIKRQAVLLLALRGDVKMRQQLHSLLAAVSDEERVPLLGQLARHRDRQAVDALRLMLPADAQSELHLRVADELLSCGHEPARAVLETIARKEGPLQLLAARLLAERDDPSFFDYFCQHLAPARPIIERILAAEGIGACRLPSAAPVLTEVLPPEAGPLRLRLTAAEALLLVTHLDPEQMATDTALWIERALGDASWPVRQQATVPLGDADPRVALPLLMRAIRDEQPEVRRSAAQSLGRTQSKDAVPALRQVLDDRAAPVRQEAMHSMGVLGQQLRAKGEKVDDILSEVTARRERGDASDRVTASGALANMGEARGQSDLLVWLKNPRPDVRYAAAALLAEQGRKEGVAELRAVAAGTGTRATIAAGLLTRLGETTTRTPESALASADVAERAAAIAEIGRLPLKEALPLFRRALHDPAPEVRRALTIALARRAITGEAAVLPSLRLLAQDSDAQVRTHAGTVLARLAPNSAGKEASQQVLAAYLRGDHKQAAELSKNLRTPLGLYAAAASACVDKNAAAARTAYERMTDAGARQQLVALCRKNGIDLPRTAQEAAATDEDQTPAVPATIPVPSTPGIVRNPAPTSVPAKVSAPLPREKTMRNKDIRLPKKVNDAIPPLQQTEN